MHCGGSGFWSTSLSGPIIVVRLSHDEDLGTISCTSGSHGEDVCDVAYLPSWFSQVLRTLNVVIFTYDQWERLSTGLQEIYLAGAIDSLSTITVPPRLPPPNIATTV